MPTSAKRDSLFSARQAVQDFGDRISREEVIRITDALRQIDKLVPRAIVGKYKDDWYSTGYRAGQTDVVCALLRPYAAVFGISPNSYSFVQIARHLGDLRLAIDHYQW